MKILSKDQMRELEKIAVENGATYFSLMEKAGQNVAKTLIEKMNAKRGDKVSILCGKGNNGGDGFIAGIHLRDFGIDAQIVLVEEDPKTSDAIHALAKSAYSKVPIWRFWEVSNVVYDKIRQSDFIIDAVYGIGFRGELNSKIKNLIEFCNLNNKRILSVDIPSGVECDSGEIFSTAFKSEMTISFSTLKPAHILYPSVDFCGQTIVSDVGIDKNLVECFPCLYKTIDKIDVQNSLPKREISAHKGSNGTLMTICGSYFMSGATIMSIKSALRSGVGLIKAVIPEKIYNTLAQSVHECIYIPVNGGSDKTFNLNQADYILENMENVNAVLIGCGISQESGVDEFVYKIIKSSKKPLIIDADGINAIAKHIDVLKEVYTSVILTPHPKEMARLLGVTVAEIQSNRIKYAKELSIAYKVITVLKGAKTVVSNEVGDVFVNLNGNSGMAKAGSGDVLAGIISSLVAQGINTFDATKAGVYIHGLAGDIAENEIGKTSMLPTDIIDKLPQAFKNLEE